MTDEIARPRPRPDAVSEGFWNAVGQGVLAIQRCTQCGNYQHPPRPVCCGCGGGELSYERVSGDATLVSWTTTHHNVVPAMAGALPFTCLVVELAEQRGLYMMSDLIGRTSLAGALRLGMPMRVVFPEPEADNPRLPQFAPAPEAVR
ncbi:MAG: OB-fold domain-containing protein [Rhodospirillales bacterium]|nr:OB-fold domain-containing protein [Rhodospirillales bacterium]